MNDLPRVDAFADVDGEADPEPWLRMLRGMATLDPTKETRFRTLFARLELRAGARALEVGCGVGGLIRLLSASSKGVRLAVGIDPSQLALQDARHLNHRPDPERLAFLAADGRALPFAANTFDAVFCNRVLVHAHEPGRILGEMARVLRPGGRALLIEPDRDAMLSSVEADRVMRVFWSERRSIHPDIGRRLHPLLHAAGLEVEDVEARLSLSRRPPTLEQVLELEREIEAGEGEHWDLVRAGRIGEDELRAYARSMREAYTSGVYLRTDVEFIYLARKPAG